MDFTTLIGFILGIGLILLGQVMEGGHPGSIIQLTAGLIVFGGTFGAVLVSTSSKDLGTAFKLFWTIFTERGINPYIIVDEIVRASQQVRKESVLSLESKIESFSQPFMKQVFRFVVDGFDSKIIRETFEGQIDLEKEHLTNGARVFSDAGGYCPTIGILGAVLGLIHVMENLSDPSKLGSGIAVAFVATVYGVGAANLIFIPIANKLRARIKHEAQIKEMILTGALGIVEGLNPLIIEERLNGFAVGYNRRKERDVATPKKA